MWTLRGLFVLIALANANDDSFAFNYPDTVNDGNGGGSGAVGCDLCNGTPLNAGLTFMVEEEEYNCGEWVNYCGADPAVCGSDCVSLTMFVTYSTPCCGDPPEDCGGSCPDRMVFNAFHVYTDSWGLPATCGGSQWWCARNMETCGGCEGFRSTMQASGCCTAEKEHCEDCVANFYSNGGCDVLYPLDGSSSSNVDVTTLMDRDCSKCFHHGKKYCVAIRTFAADAALCDWDPWMDTVAKFETTNPKAHLGCTRLASWSSADPVTCTCMSGFTAEQVAADSAIGNAFACWNDGTNWPEDIPIEMSDELYANCQAKGNVLSDDMNFEEYSGVCGKSSDELECKHCGGKWKKRKCYLKTKAKKVKCSKLNRVLCAFVGKCYLKDNGKCKGGKAFA